MVAALLAVVIVAGTAPPAGAAEEYTQSYTFSYAAGQEGLIEAGLEELYHYEYYDLRVDDVPLDREEILKRDATCTGNIDDMSAEQLALCAIRKKYEATPAGGTPDKVLIEVRPASDTVSFTVQDDKPPSSNGQTWTQTAFSVATDWAVIVIRAACVAANIVRGVSPDNKTMKAGCVATAQFLANFAIRAGENAQNGTVGNAQAWAADLVASFSASASAWVWEYTVSGELKDNTSARWSALATALGSVEQGLQSACPVCVSWARSAKNAVAEYVWRADAPVPPVKPRGLTALRILPLGDSITHGVGGSVPGTGYRARLWDLLARDPVAVDFVGGMDSGVLPDTDHEGHPGWKISQIDSLVRDCTMHRYRPNVVLLHIGTNDMRRSAAEAAGAPDRLRGLIEGMVERAPETTVLVATLVPSSSAEINGRIQQYNARIPGIVDELRGRGLPVRLVRMNAVTTSDLSDSLHPDDAGYRKMADAFHDAVTAAVDEGAIRSPENGDPGACGAAAPAPADTPKPAGWTYAGPIASGAGERDAVRFADLNGDGRDDYLVVGPVGQVKLWLNRGSGNGIGWEARGVVATGSGLRDQVRFADIDGDGRDDYLVVNDQGLVKAWFNTGTGDDVAWASRVWSPPGWGRPVTRCASPTSTWTGATTTSSWVSEGACGPG